jgi:hypothetical protein
MTKKKTEPKKSPPTLAERLRPKVKALRVAAISLMEPHALEAGERADVRRRRGNVARRVLKRIARRQFPSKAESFATIAELRQLCWAAICHEAQNKSARKR